MSAPSLAANAAVARQLEPSSTTCFAPETFRRHAFVWLTAQALCTAVAETGDLATLQHWIAHERPLIVRRPCLSPDGHEVFLGLALPGKLRMAYRVPASAIERIAPPPQWQGCPPICTGGMILRMFGSHAWQHLTGLSYVTENSDIDLLASIDSPAEWDNFRRMMNGMRWPDSPRIDLEVVFRGDASFQWREFASPGSEVLIKSNHRVWLEPKDRVEALLHA